MLGQPVYFLTPDVVGVELTGKLSEGITATDLVLTVTEMLRREKVVGKFVEFFGAGTASLAVPDRATIANMAPEYGATMGFFPVDDATVDYLTATGRTPAEIDAFASYFKAQGLYGIPKAGEIDYTKTLKLDLSSVKASLAGPKRPQDRIELGSLKSTFTQLFSKPVAENGFAQSPDKLSRRYATAKAAATATAPTRSPRVPGNGQPRNVVEMVDNHPTPDRVPAPVAKAVEIGNGDVLIAAITSCTNTSNPERAARRRPAREEGRREGPHRAVARQDFARAGLARGHRLSDESRAAPVPRQARLFARRLRLHDVHRQRRRPRARIQRSDHRQRSRLRGGALGQPQLRGADPPEPAGEFPRVAAARRRVRDRRHGAEGPRDRAARPGHRRAGLSQGHLADVARDRRGHGVSRKIRRPIARSTATSPTRIRCGARSRALPARSTTGPARPTSRSRRSSTDSR